VGASQDSGILSLVTYQVGTQSDGSDGSVFFFLLGTGLVAVLFVHELGHLLVARHYGMNVLSLSVGFGPPLMNFTDRLGTSWKLRAFPLGGSCVIDENYDSKNNSVGKQADNKLLPQLLRQRAVIYAAGPIFNLIFAAASWPRRFDALHDLRLIWWRNRIAGGDGRPIDRGIFCCYRAV
jgi:hypothetical protein